jgi:hypothetical protein
MALPSAHVSESTNEELVMENFAIGAVALLVVLVIGRLAYMAWRMNLVINHPEEHQRLRDYEREQEEKMKKSYEMYAPAIKKGGEAASKGITMLAKMLMKKK